MTSDQRPAVPDAPDVERLRGRRGAARFTRALSVLRDGSVHPQWVPTPPGLVRHLLAPSHPFWRHADRALFVARRGRTVVGRVAAIENRAHNRVHDDRVGFFGFFDVADDPGAARALMDAARAWLAGRGLDRVRGPISPSMNYESGCQVDGFEEANTFMTPWNPPWCGRLLEGAGLEPAQDLVAVWAPEGHALPGPVRRAVDSARARGSITFRDGSRAEFARQAELVRTLYNEAWADTWGFVPLDVEEFGELAAAGKHVLVERLGFFAEAAGETVGFVLLVPDYNRVLSGPSWRRWLPLAVPRMLLSRSRLRRFRVLLLGLREDYRGSRLLPLFVDELLRRAKEVGIEGAEASWLIEGGLMHRALEGVGFGVTKRWRIYEGATG